MLGRDLRRKEWFAGLAGARVARRTGTARGTAARRRKAFCVWSLDVIDSLDVMDSPAVRRVGGD